MKNGWLHDRVLLRPLEGLFLAHGAFVQREFPVSWKGGQGFIDCLVHLHGWRIACEAELHPKRVANDVAKADAAGAHWLCIITPRLLTAQACVRRLKSRPIPPHLAVCFLTVGTAREWFAHCLPLFTGSFPSSKSYHQFPVSPAHGHYLSIPKGPNYG